MKILEILRIFWAHWFKEKNWDPVNPDKYPRGVELIYFMDTNRGDFILKWALDPQWTFVSTIDSIFEPHKFCRTNFWSEQSLGSVFLVSPSRAFLSPNILALLTLTLKKIWAREIFWTPVSPYVSCTPSRIYEKAFGSPFICS